MSMTVTSFRPRAACGTSLILLTMSLGVLIAQIDTSVVNLAVKEIGIKPRCRRHRAAMGRRCLQSRLREPVADGRHACRSLRPAAHFRPRHRAVHTRLAGLRFRARMLSCWSPAAPLPGSARRSKSRPRSRFSPSPIPDTKRRAQALGVWASCNGLAFIIGPTLGGVLVESVGWRSIFFLIIPLCVVTLGADRNRRA